MEYKKLFELQNTYPNVESYKEEGNRIALNGLYPDTNKILFAKPALDSITPVSETSFRFILKLEKSGSDAKFYTSEKYFSDLQSSLKENNPYFPLESIKREFVVTLNIDETLERYSKLEPNETKWGVIVNKNIFLSKNGLDVNDLIKYVDWVVTAPNKLDIDTGGVIPAEKISTWTSSSLDTKTLTYSNTQSQTNSSTTSQLSEADRNKIQKELDEVNSVISQIEEQIRTGKFTNTNLFRTLGLISFFPLSLLLLLGNRRRKQEAKAKLEEKLKEYKNKKTDLEKKLNPSVTPSNPTNNNQTTTPTNTGNSFINPRGGGRGIGRRG